MASNTDYPRLSAFLMEFSGRSFSRGLYRVVSADQIERWDDRIAVAYPDYEGRVTCFAFDWLGRAFALDWDRLEESEPGVLMFEIGTGYALAIPCNLETFHEAELIDHSEEALAASFFEQWLAAGGKSPAVTQCIGYKRPLFLGGEDDVSNLELSDLDVYWHIVGQVAAAAKGKPPGTRLKLEW